METRVLSALGPDAAEALETAARTLAQGGLVAIPTETVYGLAASAWRPEAVARIYTVKRRPSDNPIILHVAEPAQIGQFCQPHPALERLGAFIPGPLTLVLPARPEYKHLCGPNLQTLAVRVPNHAIAQALLRQLDAPLFAPSANLSGLPSPTRAAHVLADLNGAIPLILDGGPCALGIESTVLDLSGETPLLLRPGHITADALEQALGQPIALASGDEAHRRSPGTRYRHYAPVAPLWILGPELSEAGFQRLWRLLKQNERLAYFGWRTPPEQLPPGRWIPVGPDAEQLEPRLYDALRELDHSKPTLILADSPKPAGLGASLLDRMRRAASLALEDDQAITQRFGRETQ